MISLINFCILLISLAFAIYMLYLTIGIAINSKKLKKAEKDYVEALTDIKTDMESKYAKQLGKGNDADVYYSWALEMYEFYRDHNLFSLDEILNKARKFYELETGERKDQSEDLMMILLFAIFLESDYSDIEINEELEEFFEICSKRRFELSFLKSWAFFKTRSGWTNDNLDGTRKGLTIYQEIEERYYNSDENEKKEFNLIAFYKEWQEALTNSIVSDLTSENLPLLLNTLEKMKTINEVNKMELDLDFAYYHVLKYSVDKDKAELQTADMLYQKIIDERSVDKNKSTVYHTWGLSYNDLIFWLKDPSFDKKARELFKQSIDLDNKNHRAYISLALSYAAEGEEKKEDRLFTLAINTLLEYNKHLFCSHDQQQEEIEEMITNKGEVLAKAFTILNINKALNFKTETRRLFIEVGEAYIQYHNISKLGYIAKAEGLLFVSVMDNQFNKNKKEILKLLQTADKLKEIEGGATFDSMYAYNYAAYYAQIPGEEEQVYNYMRKYITYRTAQESLSTELLEDVKSDPLFANYRHSSKFANLFN